MMGAIILGSLLFCYGLLGMGNGGGLVAMLFAATGLAVALRGVCEVTADLVARKLAAQRQPAYNKSPVSG